MAPAPVVARSALYYLIYITERCNLFCKYCDSGGSRVLHGRDFGANLGPLVAFLARDPDLHLKLYGGEPLLEPELIHRLLRSVRAKRVVLQTNGTLLHALDHELFDLIDVVSVSIDGPAAITDRNRGRGVFDRAMALAHALRRRGYAGTFDARMTITPGVDVGEAIGYFFDGCDFPFDRITWQLDVCFNPLHWVVRSPFIRDWFTGSYNPQISSLIRRWIDALVSADRYLRLVPFACLVHDLITGDRARSVRCGAGVEMWTITPDGMIYPCPIMRHGDGNAAGSIQESEPGQLRPPPALGEPCASCDLHPLCGGRCLCANLFKEWGDAGQHLVCESIRHMVRELEEVAPIVETLVATGRLALDDLRIGGDYEVIP